MTHDDAADSFSTGVQRIGLIVAVLALVAFVYAESVLSAVRIWSYDGFRHGYLIPLVSFAMLWLRRGDLAAAPVRPSWLGVVFVLLSVWLWLLARQSLIQFLEHVALLALFHSVVLAVLGRRIYAGAAFPLCYLALAIPAGADTVPRLMEFTADFSSAALRTLQIPVLRDGMFFMLPGGSFEVAEACSGYRYVFSGLALAVLIAYLDFRSWIRRVVFVVLAVGCFVLLNGVRATLVMAIASASEMRYLADDHVWFGWVLFVLVFLGMYGVAQRCSDVNARG